jgi:hypothetical protein
MIKSLILVLSLCSLALQASASGSRCEEMFKHARTAIQNEALEENQFNVSRRLAQYTAHFPFQIKLDAELAALPPGSRWVDMGAGKAGALMDGLEKYPNLLGTGIAFKKPWDMVKRREFADRFEYLDGELVENMAADGTLDHLRGKVQILTDLYGPLSYSEHLPELMQVYVDLLARGGVGFINMMSERKEGGRFSWARRAQWVNAIDSNPHGFVEWLRTIPGIQVIESRTFKVDSPRISEKSDAVKILKIIDHVVVPHTIETLSYEAGSPPVRLFRSVRDSAPAAASGF